MLRVTFNSHRSFDEHIAISIICNYHLQALCHDCLIDREAANTIACSITCPTLWPESAPSHITRLWQHFNDLYTGYPSKWASNNQLVYHTKLVSDYNPLRTLWSPIRIYLSRPVQTPTPHLLYLVSRLLTAEAVYHKQHGLDHHDHLSDPFEAIW